MESKEKQREFIKDYNKIVPFLEKVFYYGTFSSEDYEKMNMMKKSKYSDYKRILEFVFGDILHEAKNANGKKALSLNIDHFCDPHRAFLRFFTLKSFVSIERLFLTCYILQRINEKGKCTINDICIGLDELSADDEAKDRKPTVSRIIKNMVDYGFLSKTGSAYSINTGAKKLNNAELLNLIDVCTNVYPLSICGSGIQNKIDQNYQSPFLFKHLHLGQIFNDELIWKLLIFAHKKQHICVELKKGSKLRDLLPYRIITNRETGRQYIFTVYVGKEDYDEYLLIRIDNISDIKIETSECEIPDDTVLKEKYETALRYSFNGTTFLKRDQEPESGVLVYDKSFEWNIKRHFPDCEPVSIDEKHNKISIKVNSLTELKPWLRLNNDKVQLVESTDDTVEEMHDELIKWREMYGVI